MSIIKLSKWAKENGYTRRGAYDRYKRVQINGAFKTITGRIMVNVGDNNHRPDKIIIYARVSSPKQKADLERQIDRLTSFCMAKGWIIDDVVKEIASGVNDNRPKLNKLLSDKNITKVVVEHKDRLTRFGFNYITTLADFEIIVANPSLTDKDDLMQDLISIITSMTAKYYGKRRSGRITQDVKECVIQYD